MKEKQYKEVSTDLPAVKDAENATQELTKGEKELSLTEAQQEKLAQQIESEYNIAWDHIKPKWDKWAKRLKLYNNQKRDEEAVGDNTLYTVFQTVFADIYADKLQSTFEPMEIGDEETAENLTKLAKYDYRKMEKNISDYYWNWEAMFFGRSLLCLMQFDRDKKIPIPELWNVMTVLRDPDATSVNGDIVGKGRARYLGREVRMTKNEMRRMGVYTNIKDIKTSGTSQKSLIDEQRRLTHDAQGYNATFNDKKIIGENETFRILEWFTIFNGKRCFVSLANDKKTIIRYKELDSMDIPIIDRSISPMSMTWDGVSIPDLVEDKQRARAVALNLSLKSVKSALHPTYMYDSLRIKNKNDLQFGFNKFIPIKGAPNGAIQTVERQQINQDVEYIMSTLSQSAQEATATPDIKRGATPSTGGTATRDALVNQGADVRYSLAAAIFGWSESLFWKQWYSLYKKHFKDGIDEKSIRISGILGAQWRPFTRENIISQVDPDVYVESIQVSEANKLQKLQKFQQMLQFASADPNANLRFGFRQLGILSGFDKDVIDKLIPQTAQEMKAEEENILLREKPNEKVPVLPTDDHREHLSIHNKMEDTPAKIAHMNAHKRAMMLQELRPDIMPQQQAPQQAGQQQMMPGNSGVNETRIEEASASDAPTPLQQDRRSPIANIVNTQ